MKLEFKVENDNIRLSEELKLHISRRLYKNIRSKKTPIFVNGKETLTYVLVNKGDLISLEFDKNRDINWDIYESNLDIYYEDSNYLVVFKRGNLLSIPTKTNPKSLFQEVIYYLKNKNESTDISILNRLDKETKGLVLVAKNPYAASQLSPVHKYIERKYVAICHGVYKNDEGRIETGIKRSDTNKRIVSDDGQIAITNYKVIKRYNDKTLVEFKLETGRTHQIRVHSSYMGYPLYGDELYGMGDGDLKLLSYYIKFKNPFDNKDIEITIDYNEELNY